MVFSSATFLLLFLPIVFVGNLLLRKKGSNIFLLLASLLFYAWGEPYLVLLMIISVLLNWLFGIIISKARENVRKAFLAIGIICNIGMLFYFKYFDFFAKTINSVIGKEIIPVLEIALPIGISFFTFQALSYIVDVYKGDVEVSSSLVNVALYISFFPQLIAGPIVKYKDINRQIENRSVDWIGVSDGFKRFIYGLGKKVLISNVLGICVDMIYSYNTMFVDYRMAWIGAIAYTFQIYYDFSGYSDMAIGLGQMFGFRLPENFQYPYLSHSITEFWRRWHRSLGSWFREYVYIPLGGNKRGTGRTYINLFFVFLLTGLWHGANMTFVLWGAYHGLFVILERIGLKKVLDKSKPVSVIYTFFITTIGWVLFRANDIRTGLYYIEKLLMPWRFSDIHIPSWNYMDNKTVFVILCAFLGMGTIKSFIPEKVKTAWDNSVAEAIYCFFILFLCLSAIASGSYNPFIYFQF